MLRQLSTHRVGKRDDLGDGDKQLIRDLRAEFHLGQNFDECWFVVDGHLVFARKFDDALSDLTASFSGYTRRGLAIPMQGDSDVDRAFAGHYSDFFIDQLAGAQARP